MPAVDRTDVGEIIVKVKVDLWSEVLKQLSTVGLDGLEMAIEQERANRERDEEAA